MKTNSSFYDVVDQIVTDGVQKGILHLYNEEEQFTGNELVLNGNRVINFSSCSYLGLEFDNRLKQGSIDAIRKYGTQFSESRAYVSLKLYAELEELLNRMFDAHCVVTPTTTLGHIAAIPVIVGDDDAIIMDHQLHNSVQTAVNLVRTRGVAVEIIRHNRMDILENRITELRNKYRKIWYMSDGIYSMFGDEAPVTGIYRLLDKYPELYYYVDDAHGISIVGKHGRGSVLYNRSFHPKMVLAASLNKAFAAGGGAIVFPDAEQARKVKTCGGPLLSSGPMQPSGLGAAIASAKIHLSPEIETMQEELRDRIRFTNLMLQKYKLPVVSRSDASIFFVGVSHTRLGYNMIRRMLKRGYYLNLGIFPTVPMKNTGIRFTITRLHSFRQIESMVRDMAEELVSALAEEEMTLEQIYKAFKMKTPEAEQLEVGVQSVLRQRLELKQEHYKDIRDINQVEWNAIFSGKGNFDYAGMMTLQNAFGKGANPEDNWLFDYILVRDHTNRIVLATFLTTTLWKDDMLARAGISEQVEVVRKSDPYYLTSKMICCGSLLSEGEHLFIDYASPFWNDALKMLLETAYALQERYEANGIVLRDFVVSHPQLEQTLVDNSFVRFSMGETFTIDPLTGFSPETFYKGLSRRSKGHVRSTVLRNQHLFEVKVLREATEEDLDHWYGLYLNVKNRNLALNTFPLPKKLFAEMLKNDQWEVLSLRIKKGPDLPVCIVFCYQTGSSYVPMVIGIDYAINRQHNVYRQALYQIVMRAMELKKNKISFGFGAGIEKKKLGATASAAWGYMHNRDSFNQQAISAISDIHRAKNGL